MSYRLSNKWPKTKRAEYFRLFSETVIELTSSSTIESFRVHALSSLQKLHELRRSCRKVLQKNIQKISLDPIIAEVEEALLNDPVIQSILEQYGIEAETIKIISNETTEEIMSRAELLIGLVESVYREKCESIILENCLSQGSKRDLVVATKVYIAYLCGRGFHRRYIFEEAQRHFGTHDIGKTTPQLIRTFFSNFDEDNEKRFDIVFCGGRSYCSFLKSVFGLEVFDDEVGLKGGSGLSVPSDFAQGQQECLVLMKNIWGIDPYRAVSNAEAILGISRSLIFLYPSKLRERLDDRVFVFGKRQKPRSISRKYAVSVSNSRASRIVSASQGAASFSEFAIIASGKNSSARSRIIRALNSAALAGNATDAPTQLVTLWSAFEALLPPPTNDDKSPARIVHFSKMIVPALSRGYLADKYNFFYMSLTRSEQAAIMQSLEKCSLSGPEGFRLAYLFATDDAISAEIFSSLSHSPLLLNKAFGLYSLARDPKLALKKLEEHEARLNWQLHRIYRERNEIVHSGGRNSFIIPLVENAFFISDLLLPSFKLFMRGLGLLIPVRPFN